MPSNYYEVNFYKPDQKRGRPAKEIIHTKNEEEPDQLKSYAQHILRVRHGYGCIIRSIDLMLPGGNKRIVNHTQR